MGKVLDHSDSVKFLRDITRGGLAGILNELACMTGLGIDIRENDVPVGENVQAFCEVLGYDPLHMACEGKCIIIVSEPEAERVELALKNHESGKNAARIGKVTNLHPGELVLETMIGGHRLMEPPRAEKVPRIC